ARLARPAVADGVGQHDVVPGRIERLPGREQLARELSAHQAPAVAARAVHDEHGVAYHALRVAARRAEGAVVEPELRERLARGDAAAEGAEGPLARRRVGRGARGPGAEERGHSRPARRGEEPRRPPHALTLRTPRR